jgi:hypothetical protein
MAAFFVRRNQMPDQEARLGSKLSKSINAGASQFYEDRLPLTL